MLRGAVKVAIAFQLNRGVVTFPKSTSEKRLAENLNTFFKLSAEDMAAIGSLNQNARTGWGGPRLERDGKLEPRDLPHPLYPHRPDVVF